MSDYKIAYSHLIEHYVKNAYVHGIGENGFANLSLGRMINNTKLNNVCKDAIIGIETYSHKLPARVKGNVVEDLLIEANTFVSTNGVYQVKLFFNTNGDPPAKQPEEVQHYFSMVGVNAPLHLIFDIDEKKKEQINKIKYKVCADEQDEVIFDKAVSIVLFRTNHTFIRDTLLFEGLAHDE